MKELFVGTAGDFVDALEDWIIDNKCNPTTPEEWARCIKDIAEKGKVKSLGTIDDKDVNKLKTELNKDFNVENL